MHYDDPQRSASRAVRWLPYSYGGIAALVVIGFQIWQSLLPPVYPSDDALSLFAAEHSELLAMRTILVEPGIQAWIIAAVIAFLCARLMVRCRRFDGKCGVWVAGVFFFLTQLVLQIAVPLLAYQISFLADTWADDGVAAQLLYGLEQGLISWLACWVSLWVGCVLVSRSG